MGRVLTLDGAAVDDRFFKAGGAIGDKGPFLRWIGRRWTYKDFEAAATTDTVTWTIPAHAIIHDALLYCETDFAGGSVSACTFQFGITGTANGLLLATSVFTGATNNQLLNVNQDTGASTTDVTKGARGAFLWDGTTNDEHPKMGYYVGASAVALLGTLTTTTDNCSSLTAGALRLYLLVSNPLEAHVLG